MSSAAAPSARGVLDIGMSSYLERMNASKSAMSWGFKALSMPSGISERPEPVSDFKSVRRMVSSVPSADFITMLFGVSAVMMPVNSRPARRVLRDQAVRVALLAQQDVDHARRLDHAAPAHRKDQVGARRARRVARREHAVDGRILGHPVIQARARIAQAFADAGNERGLARDAAAADDERAPRPAALYLFGEVAERAGAAVQPQRMIRCAKRLQFHRMEIGRAHV